MLRGFFERSTFGGSDERYASEDPVASLAARAAIDEARERNERWVEWLAVTTGMAGIAAILWRMATIEARAGLPILAVTAFVAGYYGLSLLLRQRKPPSRRQRWMRATIEVLSASAVTVLNVKVSPEFALTSGAHYCYFIAISTAALRLDPLLSAYAGVLAVLLHLALYLVLLVQFGLPTDVLTAHPGIFGFRLVAMMLTGMVGFFLSHTLRDKTVKVATETLARERVRAAFGSYVDDRVVQRVLSGALSTGPERRTITVLFLDIRGFTAFAASRDAIEVFRCLQQALDAFSAEIQRQGGIVNKFLGDGLLAIFGAPESQDDHPRRAVRAALNIVAEARRLRESGAFPDLAVGVGIHSGEAMIGNLGGARREYTAIGDVVNVASRIEAMNKELATTILVSETVRAALGPDAETRPFPGIALRGKTEPLTLHEVQRVPTTREHAALATGAAPTPVGRVQAG